MADEVNPIAEIEPVTPAIEVQEDETVNLQEPDQPELEEENPEGELPEGEEEAEEFDTIDFDGKQYQVPKALKAGFMMNADYTRKTQEIAAHRQELEEGRERLAQQSQASEEEMSARVALAKVGQQLQQYAQVNWDELERQDPFEAQKHWRQYQQLQQQSGQLAHEINERHTQRTHEAQQETVKRLEQTQEYAKTKIKGWSPELDRQIIDWAKSKGATDSNLLNAMSPMVYEMLHLARLGEQTLKKPAAPKTQPSNVKPTSMVGAKANPPAKTSLGEMSMDEYVAYRQRKQGR